MASDEDFVKAHWTNVEVSNWYQGKNCAAQAWHVSLSGLWTGRVGDTKDDTKMWKQAAEFTRARLEAIERVEEEVNWTEIMLRHTRAACGEEAAKCEKPIVRILAREQSALAELKRGMTAPAH